MRTDYTDINILLDRSGSMQSRWGDTMGGLASFVKEQSQLSGKVNLTLAVFDDVYDVVYQGDLREYETVHVLPRANTALRDSLFKLIQETGERLASLPELERPGQVIVLVITDGVENASHEISPTVLRDTIARQEKEFSWKFLFLGATLEAVAGGKDLGMKGVVFQNNTRGIANSFEHTSAYVGSARLAAAGDEQSRGVLMAMDEIGDVEDPNAKSAVQRYKGRLKDIPTKQED